MSDKIQPSADFSSTLVAVAWEIVRSQSDIHADPKKLAKDVREVILILRGREGKED
jgi:hypothetical protein